MIQSGKLRNRALLWLRFETKTGSNSGTYSVIHISFQQRDIETNAEERCFSNGRVASSVLYAVLDAVATGNQVNKVVIIVTRLLCCSRRS